MVQPENPEHVAEETPKTSPPVGVEDAELVEYPIPTLRDQGITSFAWWLTLLSTLLTMAPSTARYTAEALSVEFESWKLDWYRKITARHKKRHQRAVRRNCQWILKDALDDIIPKTVSFLLQSEIAAVRHDLATYRRALRIRALYMTMAGLVLGWIAGAVYVG